MGSSTGLGCLGEKRRIFERRNGVLVIKVEVFEACRVFGVKKVKFYEVWMALGCKKRSNLTSGWVPG